MRAGLRWGVVVVLGGAGCGGDCPVGAVERGGRCEAPGPGGGSDAGDAGCLAPATLYLDADGDGFGRDDGSVVSCSPLDGTSERGGDCDDGDEAVHPGVPEDEEWTSEALPRLGGGFSIALDSNGAVHVAYVAFTDRAILHATNGSGAWVEEQIAVVPDSENGTAIAIDAAGAVHVAYSDVRADRTDIVHATNASGAWVSSPVAAGIARRLSLGVDAEAAGHVAYTAGARGDGELALANADGGGWDATVLDPAGDTGYEPSLVLDAAVTHIAYRSADPGALRYATDASGGWVLSTVDAEVEGSFPSLAVDAAGSAHVAYCDAAASDLRYATNESGAWVAGVLDDQAARDDCILSLALDDAGHVHIAYTNEAAGDLRYLTDETGAWVAETVAAPGETGFYPALAVDPDGGVHVVYLDLSRAEAVHAFRSGADGIDDDCDGVTR